MPARPPRLGARTPVSILTRSARWAHRVRFAALSPVLVLAAACGGGDDGPTGNKGVDGSYALVTIEGENLPATFDISGNQLVVRGADLTLKGGNYDVKYNIRVNGQSSSALDDQGTYRRDGNTVVLTGSGGTAEGTLSGARLTVVDEDDVTYVFDRR